jgi:hypothetical protein
MSGPVGAVHPLCRPPHIWHLRVILIRADSIRTEFEGGNVLSDLLAVILWMSEVRTGGGLRFLRVREQRADANKQLHSCCTTRG